MTFAEQKRQYHKIHRDHQRELDRKARVRARRERAGRDRMSGLRYRLTMRLAHRFGYCKTSVVGPINPGEDGIVWCYWCGMRGRIPNAAKDHLLRGEPLEEWRRRLDWVEAHPSEGVGEEAEMTSFARRVRRSVAALSPHSPPRHCGEAMTYKPAYPDHGWICRGCGKECGSQTTLRLGR